MEEGGKEIGQGKGVEGKGEGRKEGGGRERKEELGEPGH